ncbi:MAG: DUF2807 domain-containing protein [Saprospiraceae bacterium]
MRVILIHIIVALLLGFWPNGIAAQEGEFRSLESYHSILLKGNWDVVLEQGTEPSIRLAAQDPATLDKVEMLVQHDQLRLVYKGEANKEWKDHPRIKAYLVYPSLSGIDVEGKLLVEGLSTINAEHFELKIEGYVKGELAIVSTTCDVDLQGYFRLKLSGETQHFDLAMEGFGKVWASHLASQTANVSMEGMATAYVHATEDLYGRVEGLAKLGYTGDPKQKKIVKEGIILVSKR